MSTTTFEIQWVLPDGRIRSKFFGSLRDLKRFEKVQLKYFVCDAKYFSFVGNQREQFIVVGNVLLSKSMVMSLVNRF